MTKPHTNNAQFPSSGNARALALSAIEQWHKQEHLADAILERHRRHLSAPDSALLQSLFYGWLRHQRLLRHWASQLWKKSPKPKIAYLIELGLLQVLILELAEHAAVNETVALAPKPQRGFVNAILRQALRQKQVLLGQPSNLPPAIAHSHPNWLVKRWQSQFPPEALKPLLSWNNSPAPLTARRNPLKPYTPEEEAKEEATALPQWAEFYQFSSLPKEALANGSLYATDPSTSLAPTLLNPHPKERILDACAAPGGKSFQLAALAYERHGGLPQILATDPSERRLKRLQENLERLGLTSQSTETALHDWTTPCPALWQGKFDAVLLDLPCSNTGVLRRRVDARWRIQVKDFDSLKQLQLDIAQNALKALHPQGRLIWSTCSIDKQENAQAIEAFLQAHPQLRLIKQQQLTPWQDGVDGAFAAQLRLC